MAAESERVVQMKANFMKLHQEGWSIAEIADKFNLCTRTVYYHLDTIASQHGLKRENLLRQVHKTPAYWEHQNNSLKVDVNNLLENFNVAQIALRKISEELNALIQIIEEDLEHDNI